MEITLDSLSAQELELYQEAVSCQGSMESKAQQLCDKGVFAKYWDVHKKYLALFRQT